MALQNQVSQHHLTMQPLPIVDSNSTPWRTPLLKFELCTTTSTFQYQNQPPTVMYTALTVTNKKPRPSQTLVSKKCLRPSCNVQLSGPALTIESINNFIWRERSAATDYSYLKRNDVKPFAHGWMIASWEWFRRKLCKKHQTAHWPACTLGRLGDPLLVLV